MGQVKGAWLLAMLMLLVAEGACAAGQVIEAHSGTHKGTVYEATPTPYAPPAAAANAPAATAATGRDGSTVSPSVTSGEGGSAPREAGAGVEIISGGGSTAGAARVGRMPVLQ